MKLMLTSAGITNKSLEKALRKLVGTKMKIAFIPTAANVEEDEKDWLIDDLSTCKRLGKVDIVDISALPREIWLPRLQKANVIFVGGGDTPYLMNWIKKSGLIKEFPELLKTRIYVGISAGSIVLSKTLFASSEFIYGNEDGEIHTGLGYINFHFRPHLNSPNFPKVREGVLKRISSKFDRDLYAVDDQSGIVLDNGKVQVISEGKWIKYPKQITN